MSSFPLNSQWDIDSLFPLQKDVGQRATNRALLIKGESVYSSPYGVDKTLLSDILDNVRQVDDVANCQINYTSDAKRISHIVLTLDNQETLII